MKLLFRIILSGLMITFFNSCDNKELKNELAAANLTKDSLQGVVDSWKEVADLFGPLSAKKPAHLLEIDETKAKGYIENYVKLKDKKVTAEAIPHSFTGWLIKNYHYEPHIALHIGHIEKECYLTVFVVLTAKEKYKYFVDDRDTICPPDVSTTDSDDHIPPCTPTSCPCRYYAKPCTP